VSKKLKSVNIWQSYGRLKMRDMKYGTVKNAGPENARHEFAAPVCTGGNCGT